MDAKEMAEKLVTVDGSAGGTYQTHVGGKCVLGWGSKHGAESGARIWRETLATALAPLLEQVRADAAREALAAPVPGLMSEEEAASILAFANKDPQGQSDDDVRALYAERAALIRLLLDCEDGTAAYRAGYEAGKAEEREACARIAADDFGTEHNSVSMDIRARFAQSAQEATL